MATAKKKRGRPKKVAPEEVAEEVTEDEDESTDSVSKALAKMQKKFKKASIRRLADGAASASREVIPTRLDVLDNWVFGVGGIPGNKIIEVFGDADSGKTSLILNFLAAAQRAGGIGVLLETENTLKTERAKIHGCNMNDIILAEPDSSDDVVEQMKALLEYIPKGVGPNIIAWDSLAAAPTDAAIKGKGDIGNKARQLSRELPIMSKLLAKKRTSIIIINQIRYKVGVMFGNPVTTPGGEALKFMSSCRLQLWAGKNTKDGEDVIGQYTTIKAVKNKLAIPQRKARFELDYEAGWLNRWSVINFAKDRKLIPEDAKQGEKTYKEAIEALREMEGWYRPET